MGGRGGEGVEKGKIFDNPSFVSTYSHKKKLHLPHNKPFITISFLSISYTTQTTH